MLNKFNKDNYIRDMVKASIGKKRQEDLERIRIEEILRENERKRKLAEQIARAEEERLKAEQQRIEEEERQRLENEARTKLEEKELLAKQERERLENERRIDEAINKLSNEIQEQIEPLPTEIVITDEIIEKFEPILNQIPVEVVKSVVGLMKIIEEDKIEKNHLKTDFEPPRCKKFIEKDDFAPIIKTDKKILVLRNNMPKLEKSYTNLKEFIEENMEYFIKAIITDRPHSDQYRYVLCDNPINNPLGLIDIFKSWDFTPYESFKQSAMEKHKQRHIQFRFSKIKEGKITVITCIRNHLEYLKDSISSLIEQTGIGADAWHNIIINDGSTEEINLEAIFGEDYPKVEPYLSRITIVNNKEWKGVVACQMQAIDMVNTEFVGILDGDDRLEPNCISRVLEKYREYSGENVFVYTNFYFTDRDFNRTTPGFCKEPGYGLLFDGFGLAFRTWRIKDYLKTPGYNPKFRYGGEDMDILYKLEAVAKPVFLNEYLYLYRRFNEVDPAAKKPKQHLSLSKYHRYNCRVARIVNAIERFGNVFHIKIYGRFDPIGLNEEELIIYRNTFQNLRRSKKPFKYMGQEYYVELFIGTELQYSVGLLKIGTYNDMNIRWFLVNYRNTGNYKHQVYVQYSHLFDCLCVGLKAIPLDINTMLDLHINYLYDEIYVSTNNNILNIDLNNLPKHELIEYTKYIKDYCSTEIDNNFFFQAQNLGIGLKRYYNVKDII